MIKIEPTFDCVLSKNEGLLNKLANKLHRDIRFRNCSFQDVLSVVNFAALNAWNAQRKQAEDNGGIAKYTFGTYINYHIQNAIKEYDDMYPQKTLSLQENSYIPVHNKNSDAEREELREFIIAELLKLDDTMQEILIMRFWEGKTLKECSEALGISIEWVRHLQNNAKHQLRYALEK